MGVRNGGAFASFPPSPADTDMHTGKHTGKQAGAHTPRRTDAQTHRRTVPVEEDVVGLQVPVDVAQGVDRGHGHGHLRHVLPGGRLGEGVLPDQQRHEVPACGCWVVAVGGGVG